MTVLITGVAGFVGAATTELLLKRGERVHGVDNLNSYYDVNLKSARLARLQAISGFTFTRMDVAEPGEVVRLFQEHKPDTVLHLAAQAGVRSSLKNFDAYVQSNLVGFANILDGCRMAAVGHLVFSSSSSVYGANQSIPFSEHHDTDRPISMYAATKKAGELLAHSYAHLYQLPCTGLRLFTVYGPWGRPDMALFSFTRAILAGRVIDLILLADLAVANDSGLMHVAVGCLLVRCTVRASRTMRHRSVRDQRFCGVTSSAVPVEVGAENLYLNLKKSTQ